MKLDTFALMLSLKSYTQHFRQNINLAFPIMLGHVGQVAVNLADNVMVGRLGSAALAAVSLSHAVFVIFVVIGFGLSYALPPLLSEAEGSGDQKYIARFFKHSFVVNMLFGVFTVVAIVLFNNVLAYFDQDPEVVLLAKPYLLISAFSMLPVMAFQTFRTYADGMSDTKPAMYAIIIGNIINILLNYCFIFGEYGFPEMGVRGAAIASLIARVVMLIIIIGVLRKKKNLWIHVASTNFFKFTKAYFRRLLDLGVPTVLQGLFEISAFSGASLLMGIISKEAQAGHQIAISLASMTFLICTGLSMAATIRVGNQYGKKNWRMVREVGMSNILLVALFMTITTGCFLLWNEAFPHIYIDDPEVIGIAATLLIFAGIFQIPDGVQVTALGALRGIQDVKIPTFITFVSYWIVGIPLSYISVKYWGMGPVGVWLGLIVGLTISASLQTVRFWRMTRLRG